jgi:integrase
MSAHSNAVADDQTDSQPVSVAEEVAATRARALLLTTAEQVPYADAPSLLATQAVLQHGTTHGRWQTPRRWFTTATPVKLDVDLRARIIAGIPDQDLRRRVTEDENQPLLDQAVTQLTRYLVVLRMGPAGMGRKRAGASLDPRSIAEIAYFVGPALFAVALMGWMRGEQSADAASGLLRVVKLEDLDVLSPSIRRLVLVEARRMAFLNERDCWNDLACLEQDPGSTTAVAGDAPQREGERSSDPHLPLPDEYVSLMGQRSIWLIESLAPNLLSLAQAIRDIWLRTADATGTTSPPMVEHRRRTEVSELLERWRWADADGRLIERPPFSIILSSTGSKQKGASTNEVWPPRNLAAVFGLIGNVQLAHLFVVSLSTGGRKAETLDLQRTCLEYARDGRPYATGRTFKLVRRIDGELRDWVLPDMATKAIEQQRRLVELIETIGPQRPPKKPKARDASVPTHLWLQVSGGGPSDRTKPLMHLDKAMRAYARALGMDERPSGQWLRPHRFRKTVARLAALALTQAPKVLMDVFGHKSIEMTLYYILSDKALQAEIEQVGRELRVMRASDAIEAIVAAEDAGVTGLKLGGYGGPAALMIDRAIQVHRERVHRRGEQWGAGSVRELAEVLTLQGKAWEVVRHGVVCTKLPGSESGPCNKSKGRPEPSHCQTDCRHRLEDAFLREDVDASISSCVAEYEVAKAANDELMQAMWAGQIRAHVSRFNDLRSKWMVHPTVMRALGTSDEIDLEEAA